MTLPRFGVALVYVSFCLGVHGQTQAQGYAIAWNGNVTAVVVTNGGSGYESPPSVYIMGGGGLGATAIAHLTNGTVASIQVQNWGSNYTSLPTLVIAPPVELAKGMIGWWRGESNTLDELGWHNGPVLPGLRYSSGEVGHAFYASRWLLDMGPDPVFNLDRDFTIEMWCSSFPVPHSPYFTLAAKTDYTNGWKLYVPTYYEPSRLCFASVGHWTNVSDVLVETVGSFNHVAVTRSGERYSLYYNGTIIGTTNRSEWGDSSGNLFLGASEISYIVLIDEPAIYERALSALEIKAIYDLGSTGKVLGAVTHEPTRDVQLVMNLTNELEAQSAGTPPLFYQWYHNNVGIPNGTNQVLQIMNPQNSDAGEYRVQVWNQYGGTEYLAARATVVEAGLGIGKVPRLTIRGQPGKTYSVQASPSLTGPQWQTITNLTLQSEVQVWHDDSADVAGIRSQLYYRVIIAR